MPATTIEQASPALQDMFHKGLGAMERGNLDYAIDIFGTCIETEPTLVDVRKYLYAAEVKKARTGSRGPLQRVVSAVSGGIPLLHAMARMKAGAYSQALGILQDCLKADPLNRSFINAYCQAAEGADLPEVAIAVLSLARELYPNDTALLFYLGNLFMNAGQIAEARDCFDRIVKINPHDSAALKALKDSMALQSLARNGLATAESTRTVMKDTKAAELLEKQAKAVRSTDDTNALIDEARARIEQQPNNVNYYRALANLCTSVGRFDEAIEVLKKAQEIRGSADPELDATLGATRLKQYDQKMTELSRAGRTEEAEAIRTERNAFYFEDIQDRVGKYPNDLNLRYELGVAFFGRDMFNEAIQQFQLSQKNPRWHSRSLYYLGLALKAKKQYDLALEQLEKAAAELASMDSAKKDIYYELGAIKEAMNDHQAALAYYKEIYQVDIAYKDVARRVEQGYVK